VQEWGGYSQQGYGGGTCEQERIEHVSNGPGPCKGEEKCLWAFGGKTVPFPPLWRGNRLKMSRREKCPMLQNKSLCTGQLPSLGRGGKGEEQFCFLFKKGKKWVTMGGRLREKQSETMSQMDHLKRGEQKTYQHTVPD